jgi:enamine deaminase RidA (YjgF/YER057c/UK114 family)
MRRINPDGMYDPPNDLFTQVVESNGGRHVHVAGTVSANEDGEVVGESMDEQTRVMLENLETSLDAVDANPSDVVRNTIYTVDAEAFLESGYPQIVEFFGEDTLPASALVGVDHLAAPAYLVEIETTAIVEK